jgi:hypothetical protein
MKKVLFYLMLIVPFLHAYANDKEKCEKAHGEYLVGTVVEEPKYRPSKQAWYSHSDMEVKVGDDVYFVPINNAFTPDFDTSIKDVPGSLKQFKVNVEVSMCGSTFSNDGELGIHFVHVNCAKPQPRKPDGWLKRSDEEDSVTDSRKYCDKFSK